MGLPAGLLVQGSGGPLPAPGRTWRINASRSQPRPPKGGAGGGWSAWQAMGEVSVHRAERC
eukprot:422195-Rhodomonas_salina.1